MGTWRIEATEVEKISQMLVNKLKESVKWSTFFFNLIFEGRDEGGISKCKPRARNELYAL